MPQSVTPDREDVTAWLLALLAEVPGDYPVGDHGPPPASKLADKDVPWWVVWSIPGGVIDGPALGATSADAAFVYQVDSVGRSREQSGRLATRARLHIAGRARDGSYAHEKDSPVGIVITDRYPDGGAGAPSPQGDRPNEVWTTSDRYVIAVTTESS